MSLRAKRVALMTHRSSSQKDGDHPTEPASKPQNGTPASPANQTPNAPHAEPETPPIPHNANPTIEIAPQASSSPNLIPINKPPTALNAPPSPRSSSRSKRPPHHILDDSINETNSYDFEKERFIVLSGKDAKELTPLCNIPVHDIVPTRRRKIIMTLDEAHAIDSKNTTNEAVSYMMPSPADIVISAHDANFLKDNKASVPAFIEPTLSLYKGDWVGLERPYRNIGIPGPLPPHFATNVPATAPSSPRKDSTPVALRLTTPEQTSALSQLFIPPSAHFVVPRIPLNPLTYESGPNADHPRTDPPTEDIDTISETEETLGASSEELSMMETSGASESKDTKDTSSEKSGSKARPRPSLDILTATATNDTNSKFTTSQHSESDPIEPSLLIPSEEGKYVMGVHRDLLMGQLYPLPDPPHVTEAAPIELPSNGVRFKVTPKELSFSLGAIEPMFGILALYNMSTSERVSENFYFDLNNEATQSLLPMWHEAAMYSGDGIPGHTRQQVEASFLVPHPSPDIWLVLRVEKVLQGEAYDTTIDPYLKPETFKDSKEFEKLDANIMAFCSRLGSFRQPFCWGILQIFNEDKQLMGGPTITLKQLHRYRGDYTDNYLFESYQEIKAGTARRLKFVPGSFSFDCELISENPTTLNRPVVDWTGRLVTDPIKVIANLDPLPSTNEESSDSKAKRRRKREDSVSSSSKAVKILGASASTAGRKARIPRGPFKIPDYYPTHEYIQEIIPFPAPVTPHTDLHNVAYVYPGQLIMNKSSGQVVARNLAVQVSLLCNEADEPHQAIHAIYAREQAIPLANSQFTVVNYHDKTPKFYDEFKIALPLRLTNQHVLKFSFYHIQCSLPKKDSAATSTQTTTGGTPLSTVSTLVGYATHPLLFNDTFQEGEITLPVISVGDGAGSQSIGGGSLSLKSAAAAATSMIMDPKKSAFSFKLRLVSSMLTSDKALQPFFQEYGKSRQHTKALAKEDNPKESSMRLASLLTSLGAISKAKPRRVIQYLPTILHQMFHMICTQPTPVADRCFHVLVQLLQNVYHKEDQIKSQSISSFLQHYLDHLFLSPPNLAPLVESSGVTFEEFKSDATIANSLYVHLIRSWGTILIDHGTSDHDKLHRFAWFFFKLIYISMCVHMLKINSSTSPDILTATKLSEMATKTLLDLEANSKVPAPATGSSSSGSSDSYDADGLVTKDESGAEKNEEEEAAQRVNRFSDETKKGIKKLIQVLSWEVQERLSSNLNQSRELCKRIASFLVDMLSIADRGFVMGLMTKSLSILAPTNDQVYWELRSDFWKIITSYEHWPQLSLPQSFHIDGRNIGTLEDLFAKNYYIVHLLLDDLLNPQIADKSSRMRCLHILQTLFTKADLDPRINPAIMNSVRKSQDGVPPTSTDGSSASKDASSDLSDEDTTEKSSKRKKTFKSKRVSTIRSRRAAMQQMALCDPTTSPLKTQYIQAYFPIILKGIDNLENLKKADFDEKRVFLTCWIYVLKNMDPRLLRQWWKFETLYRNTGFLKTLTLISQVFEYQGYYSLLSQLSVTTEVKKSVATKAMIEELYAENNTSQESKGTGIVSPISLRQKRLDAIGKQKSANAPTVPITSSPSPAASATPPLSGLGGSMSPAIGAAAAQLLMNPETGGTVRGRSGSTGGPGSGKTSKRRGHGSGASISSSSVGHTTLRKWRHPGLDQERGKYDTSPVRESRISREVSLVILDIMEYFLVTKESELSTLSQNNQLMEQTVTVLVTLLSTRQDVDVQILLLRVLTGFAHTFSKPLFSYATNYCAQIMPTILHMCNYENEQVRLGASAFFFLLCRLNLANTPSRSRNIGKIKVQAIVALSKLVAGQNGIRDPSYLNLALNGIQAYAKYYISLEGKSGVLSFGLSPAEDALLSQQTSLLSERLHDILEGSIKIQQHSQNSDMLVDLYHQIASSYRTAPDLRVAWLESLADLHGRNENWAEAAQCLVHIAALISEYLQILEPTEGSTKGAAAFESACVSAVEEQTMIDAQHILDEDSAGETRIFTETGLVDAMERSIEAMIKAQLYESANELYKLLLPMHEKNHDYAKLSAAYSNLSVVFNKIMEVLSNQSRLFGSYYRVGFWGARFGDLNQQEYIYKEPKITRLGEIQERLLQLYGHKLGIPNIQVITTSAEVVPSKLDKDQNYLQITHVQPYFDAWELKQRKTDYEKNTNVGRFIFETPFSKSNTKSPSVSELWKRKTIITADSTFPYLKRRLSVTSKEIVELSPIETSIELIEGRIRALSTQLENPNAKTLQHVLQGSVRSSVHAGPTEIAKAFLQDPEVAKSFGADADRLKSVLQEFLDICQDALIKNKEIIPSSQLNFHQELEDGFTSIKEFVQALL